MRPTVELIYFSNCPHVESARKALEKAFKALRIPPEWQEWEQHDPNAPAVVRTYPSPTVLINGSDVQGGAGRFQGMNCRVGGPPTADEIRWALAEILASEGLPH
jgi:mercuric ion transport protein